VSDYETINRELAAYDENLAARPQIVVATKIDALDEPERLEDLKRRAEQDGRHFFAISSATQEGVRDLVNYVGRALDEMKEERDAATRRRGDAEMQEHGDAATREDEDAAVQRSA
jgi:GTP-binding protein